MIDSQSLLPKHQQVAEYVRRLVVSEGLKAGDRLPSEKALAERFGVSLMTANKALVALARDGVVVRHQGRGTFVADADALAGRTTGFWALGLPEPNTPPLIEELRHSQLSLGVIYRGVLAGVQRLGMAVMPIDVHRHDLLTIAARPDISGLLLIGPHQDRALDMLQLAHHGTRFVVVSASWPGLALPCVDGDNVGGARAAVRHLVELGHRRLALIISRMETTNSRDRCMGYQLEMSENGLEPGPRIEVDEQDPSSWEQIADLLSRPDRPTAVFAGGYEHVIHCLETARRCGLQVPGDLSLVGFDDVPSAARLSPPLTMVRQPWSGIAHRATQKLAQMRSSDCPDLQTETLPMHLIVRGSTGPPGAIRATRGRPKGSDCPGR